MMLLSFNPTNKRFIFPVMAIAYVKAKPMTAGGMAEVTPNIINKKVTVVANNSIRILTHIIADNLRYAGVFDMSMRVRCRSTKRLSALKALIVLSPIDKLSYSYRKVIH